MDDQHELFPIETFTPEEMGWVKVGLETYELPDGKLYLFPPGQPHLIQKMVGPIPKYRGGNDGEAT